MKKMIIALLAMLVMAGGVSALDESDIIGRWSDSKNINGQRVSVSFTFRETSLKVFLDCRIYIHLNGEIIEKHDASAMVTVDDEVHCTIDETGEEIVLTYDSDGDLHVEIQDVDYWLEKTY